MRDIGQFNFVRIWFSIGANTTLLEFFVQTASTEKLSFIWLANRKQNRRNGWQILDVY